MAIGAFHQSLNTNNISKKKKKIGRDTSTRVMFSRNRGSFFDNPVRVSLATQTNPNREDKVSL